MDDTASDLVKEVNNILSIIDESSYRIFKSLDSETGETTGRYTGQTPKEAARNYYRSIINELEKCGKKPPSILYMYLKEKMQDGSKCYGYVALHNINYWE